MNRAAILSLSAALLSCAAPPPPPNPPLAASTPPPPPPNPPLAASTPPPPPPPPNPPLTASTPPPLPPPPRQGCQATPEETEGASCRVGDNHLIDGKHSALCAFNNPRVYCACVYRSDCGGARGPLVTPDSTSTLECYGGGLRSDGCPRSPPAEKTRCAAAGKTCRYYLDNCQRHEVHYGCAGGRWQKGADQVRPPPP